MVQGSDDVRRLRFDVRQAPYTIGADVAIPAAPDPARLAIDLALDAIPVEVRVGAARRTSTASLRRRWMR